MKTKHFFNLIEVTLAIAIAGLGMAGIMVLFLVGFKANRESISENYTSDSAEQFMQYIAKICQRDWNVVASIAVTKHDETSDPEKNLAWNTDGTKLLDGNINFVDDGTVTPAGEPDRYDIFRIMQGSNLFSNGQILDYYATIKIWKSQISINVYNQETEKWEQKMLDYNQATAINLEVSWPVEKPYNVREKRYFYIEVFKPKP